MLYREIIAACGQNVELLNVKLVVHSVYSNHWGLRCFIFYLSGSIFQ
jgi:hypothetical protein